MKKLTTQRRLAAEILNTGKAKVIFDPLRFEDISKAITRLDIRDLIKDKAITRRFTKKQRTKKEARNKGLGHIRKRLKRRKERYMAKIRKIRRYLSETKNRKIISKEEYQYLRRLAKSGHFKTRRHLKEHLTTVLKKNLSNEETNKSAIQKKKAE